MSNYDWEDYDWEDKGQWLSFRFNTDGGGRYVPGSSGGAGSAGGATGGADPFTGASAHTSSEPPYRDDLLFPKREVVFFEIAKAEGLLRKLAEFNGQVSKSKRVDAATLTKLEELVPALVDGKCSEELDGIMEALMKWPADKLFPVLDILRLMIRHSCERMCTGEASEQMLSNLIEHSRDPLSTNCLVALRALSNMCGHKTGVELLLTKRMSVYDVTQRAVCNGDKHHQIAGCTLFLNLAVVTRPQVRKEIAAPFVASIVQVLSKRPLADDALFRALVALGTCIYVNEPCQAMAEMYSARQLIVACRLSTVPKVREVAEQLLQFMPPPRWY